jgi:hypothetical protein
MRRHAGAVLALLGALGVLGLARSASAEEVYLLAGISDRSNPPSTTYGWQMAFDKSLGARFDASLAWINEGHFADHERDGAAAQLWVVGPRWGTRQVGLDLGIGPYLFFDTQPADTARGYSDVHGLGGVLSAALSVPLGHAWVADLRANEILTRDDLSTFTLLAGVGYHFGLSARGPGSNAAPAPPGAEPAVLELLGGETVINSLSTRQWAAFGLDYRLPIVHWAAWSASWFDDTHAPSGLHQRVASQGWLTDGPLLGQRLTLSAGVGPYVLLGPLPAGGGSSARVSGISALRADWRAAPRLAVILTWYRTFTNDDLDRDLFSLGLGWTFGAQ